MSEETSFGEITLQDTIIALQGGIERVDKEKGVVTIDHWITQLMETGQPKFTSIAEDLRELKDSLNEEVVSRQTISDKLISIGQKTASLTAEVDSEYKISMAALGNILTKAGNSIR
ncbi:hypothetical protein SAMN05421823_105238 [Catalinimonas alkaloidigena]|uniref:Uncharacterized protein n=1 Tax=Catalinimonas alkaloidigena TaxID=1075417 RepID=A0A1G9J9C0_9BACT|nr:hypothetical protein [Catalinimonas alkaloidigena]SDL33806.1 hypothetical protein SAMN05421823_105238 [Catalinimonas alkaloidigena]